MGHLTRSEPTAVLDARFSSPGAEPVPWADARARLVDAPVFWLSTVRPDGRPHVTPLLAVWSEEALYFCTGPTERKARNLAENPHCVLTTGTNALDEGLDLVVEGDAVRVRQTPELSRVALVYEFKYGPDWRYEVADEAFHHVGGCALVYRVDPVRALGFGKGTRFSQTAWNFEPAGDAT
ncbi:pyridoxamine 5'-phosphate oxidase family protein [Catellatospora sp. KI3]|uniref:pyridoxamine 5'-phosphate oxidase family protein n=1 Tax=Catellatospora sp. KI3 TaxID=3041620 RepID=UPI002482473B|nr:pyridoxamine 5'-phosphate oxidase family protein [Catellatospora sp. KI3]MDI1462720.1 pyridoxamine 5'-phosphate oxidase family protein [Catellatospora sp. KI3]